ncbi:hypothetical protein Tco_0861703 [Tanacetum coccineum]|uniref:Uncharacterized protein n=1 Tax=Tanacetum coccineum TaxID=301880 RepID=A0ABQ5BIJ6_9ASTR
MQHAELAALRETDRRRQDQMIETLRVIRDMRREMSDMQTELLALREPQRRARQPGQRARIPGPRNSALRGKAYLATKGGLLIPRKPWSNNNPSKGRMSPSLKWGQEYSVHNCCYTQKGQWGTQQGLVVLSMEHGYFKRDCQTDDYRMEENGNAHARFSRWNAKRGEMHQETLMQMSSRMSRCDSVDEKLVHSTFGNETFDFLLNESAATARWDENAVLTVISWSKAQMSYWQGDARSYLAQIFAKKEEDKSK